MIDRVLICRQKKYVSKQILVYGYRVFWGVRRIHNCHSIAEALEKTFTVPLILFNKHLACLNDHCLKMASRGRWKGTVSKYTQKNAILNYFHPKNTTSEAKKIARSILNNVFNSLVTDSSDIAFDLVNEIV